MGVINGVVGNLPRPQNNPKPARNRALGSVTGPIEGGFAGEASGKLNQFPVIHHETEQQITELKQKVSDKEFEKMTKNLNRFCGNLAACAPILIGAFQVLSNV